MTKNVLISVCANGALQHWHTTSGKLLHTIYDELNQYKVIMEWSPRYTLGPTALSDVYVASKATSSNSGP